MELQQEGISTEELREDKRELLITLKLTENAGLLMLEQAQIFSTGLKLLAESQDKQKEVLQGVLGELGKKKRHYAVRLKMAKVRQEAEELAKVALNFDRTLGDLFGHLKQLGDEVIKVDEDLAKSADNIKVLVEDIMTNQSGTARIDQVSNSILDFQISSYGQQANLRGTFEAVREVKNQHQPSYYVKDEVLDRVNIRDAVGKINAHVDGQLGELVSNLGLNLVQSQEILPDSSEDIIDVNVAQSSKSRVGASPAPLQEMIREDLGNGVNLEMVLIPAGNFMMGSNERDREKPIHNVVLEAFYLGKYPITQAQYQAVMNNNPSYFKGKNKPVETVSWQDAQEFCRKLSERTGKIYQLPSEAQWEYACRAGNQGKWCFGDNKAQLGDYAWYDSNSNGQTHPVGQKKPNNWGLYDMHGNVWEWCEDDYDDNYSSTPTDGSSYKGGNKKCVVLRGGSWGFNPLNCRSAYRGNGTCDYRNLLIGFRVVCGVGRTS
ncbi:MAG: formylglycine-generating enzyme family protein [Microcystaceae cyanobacterium]